MGLQARATPPPIWFLALSTAVAVAGLTILTPTLPMIRDELGVSSAAVQQLLTVYMVALAVGQLVMGPISDRFGRRPLLLTGAVLYTLAGLGMLLTDSIAMLTALRVLQGVGAAGCTSMGRAMVNDAFAREEAARQMSTIAIILAIVPALSLAFGGVLATQFGWQATMGSLGIAGLVLVLTAFSQARETHLQRLPRIDVGSVMRAYVIMLSNRPFLYWTICGAMQIGIFFSLNGFLAYQYQRHGYSLSEFGLWFALTPVFFLIGNSCNRRWFVARGLERVAMLGSVLSLVAVVSLYLTQAAGMTHALSLALPCALFGFSNGIVVANVTIGAISTAGKHAGTASGIVGASQMAIGGIAGAIIVALGGAEVFAVAAGALIIMSLISVVSIYAIFHQHRAQTQA